MPHNGQPVEYRITFHRVGGKHDMFAAPGFTALVTATSPEDAVRQAEEMAARNEGHFQVVNIHPANSASTPASADDPIGAGSPGSPAQG